MTTRAFNLKLLRDLRDYVARQDPAGFFQIYRIYLLNDNNTPEWTHKLEADLRELGGNDVFEYFSREVCPYMQAVYGRLLYNPNELPETEAILRHLYEQVGGVYDETKYHYQPPAPKPWWKKILPWRTR